MRLASPGPGAGASSGACAAAHIPPPRACSLRHLPPPSHALLHSGPPDLDPGLLPAQCGTPREWICRGCAGLPLPPHPDPSPHHVRKHVVTFHVPGKGSGQPRDCPGRRRSRRLGMSGGWKDGREGTRALAQTCLGDTWSPPGCLCHVAPGPRAPCAQHVQSQLTGWCPCRGVSCSVLPLRGERPCLPSHDGEVRSTLSDSKAMGLALCVPPPPARPWHTRATAPRGIRVSVVGGSQLHWLHLPAEVWPRPATPQGQ